MHFSEARAMLEFPLLRSLQARGCESTLRDGEVQLRCRG